MDARIVAYVAARLLALYLVVGNALTLAAVAIAGLFEPSEYRGLSVSAASISAVIYLVAGITLWTGSRWISDRVAGSLKAVDLKDCGPDRWKALSVAVAGGLSLMAALKIFVQPSLWVRILMGQMTLWKPEPSPLDAVMPQEPSLMPILFEVVVFAVFGIALIACQNTIVRAINSVVNWANKPFIEEREP